MRISSGDEYPATGVCSPPTAVEKSVSRTCGTPIDDDQFPGVVVVQCDMPARHVVDSAEADLSRLVYVAGNDYLVKLPCLYLLSPAASGERAGAEW